MTYDKVAYNKKYNKENYTELKFRVPKGQKEAINNHWQSKGYTSLNSYINDLIKKDMNNEKKNNTNVIIGRDNNGIIDIN